MALERSPAVDDPLSPRAEGRIRRLVPAVFVLVAIALIPWTVWLSWSLPSRHLSEHWDVAWGGFDVGLALAFAATGFAALRCSPWLDAAAAVTGTMLLIDGWFDVVTSTRSELRVAILEAVALELPLAALCFAIARDAERFRARLVDWAAELTSGLGARWRLPRGLSK